MKSTSHLCCFSHPHSFNDTCSNCKIWQLEGVKVRKSRWNASVFNFKCDYGPHTKNLYLSMEGDVQISSGETKHNADAHLNQTTPKRRAPIDYKEKDSNEFKVADNLYRTGWYNNVMNSLDFDDVSNVSIPDVIHRGRGCSATVPNHRTTARFQQWCQ
jgi:hypothetical protein